MAFVACHFLETDEVAVLSSKWICDKNMCQWPPMKDKLEIKRAVLEHEVPQTSWTKYKIVVIGRYDNYLTAKKKAELSLDTSNLDTEASYVEKDKSRKKRQRETFQEQYKEHDDNDSDDDESLKIIKSAKTTSELPFVFIEDSILAKMKRESVSLSESPAQSNLPAAVPEDTASPSQSCVRCLRPLALNNSHISSESCQNLEKDVEMHQPSETVVIKMLKQIASMVREHTLLLRKILPVEENGACSIPMSMPDLPLQTHSDLEAFETFLNNASNFNNSVKYFGYRTTSEVNSSTRRLMAEILSDDLAEHFNWAGRPPKKPFKILKSASLILCALKENPVTKNVPSNTIESIIKDWLKHASFRKNYKMKKNNLQK